MLLVFGCIISDTCREWLLAQFWSAQRCSVFAGNFCLALDTETWPLCGSVLGHSRGWCGGRGPGGGWDLRCPVFLQRPWPPYSSLGPVLTRNRPVTGLVVVKLGVGREPCYHQCQLQAARCLVWSLPMVHGFELSPSNGNRVARNKERPFS